MVKEYLPNKKVLIPALFFISILVMLFYFTNSHSTNYNQSSNSGIIGKVLLGPLTPVVREGDTQPNEKPYSNAAILIKDSQGRKTITEVISDENGGFKVNLIPGSYKLEPLTPKEQTVPVGRPQIIEVKPNEFTNITINYDTGIR